MEMPKVFLQFSNEVEAACDDNTEHQNIYLFFLCDRRALHHDLSGHLCFFFPIHFGMPVS